MLVLRFLAATLVAGCTASASPGLQTVLPAAPSPPSASVVILSDAAERGRVLTSTACAGCHATGRTGASPMAAAPPFREVAHRYPLNQLEESFGEGLVTGHPAMPQFVFRASEIDDLIAYLETLRTDR